MKHLFYFFLILLVTQPCKAEDGYRLWLRYGKISDPAVLQEYKAGLLGFYFKNASPTIDLAKKELSTALSFLLGSPVQEFQSLKSGAVIIGKSNDAEIKTLLSPFPIIGKEGFAIQSVNTSKGTVWVITSHDDAGILYGVFHFIRLLQTHQPLQSLNISSTPAIQRRVLNHWDNLDRHVERGYAGLSIWNWHTLPGYIDQRYIDYARANASIGINGTVLTNVNANALVLTKDYLQKVAALANCFRPYNLKVYLTARFSAPIEIGGLKTADPLDTAVRKWWRQKAGEIYQLIPDFGGFLVKANSEGQPGPQNYGRTHADGANMLADVLSLHGGIVMWRAFVYSNESPEDRFKQAYSEFKPLDGKFRPNVMVQVKNGPIDFQPREPFHPLFGAMPSTPLMMEFQITQEYLGFATHLVFLPSLFKEVLNADTYAKGPGSYVSKVIDGSLHQYRLTGMAGVANIGNERNWTGHPFGQANWYGFGRLAWDPSLREETIIREWASQTFTTNSNFLAAVTSILMHSHEAVVNYMAPLGLHHIMGYGHHFGPAPWYDKASRVDWNPVYFHKADDNAIGFDRTGSGSNALSQYFPGARNHWEVLSKCPEKYLLWFHHVCWDHRMKSGRTLWEELCLKYNQGVDSVRSMKGQWSKLKGMVDEERFNQVSMLLTIQLQEAIWWRDACLSYFQTFSDQPIPSQYEKPLHTLEYYKSLSFPNAPGNGR